MRKKVTAVFLVVAFLAGCSEFYESDVNTRYKDEFVSEPVQVTVHKIPESAEIVYHHNGFIYVMDRLGVHVQQITYENPRHWEHVAVSYDRTYVVANEQLPNPDREPGGVSRLWLFDLKKGTEAQLVPHFLTAGNGGVDWDEKGFIYFAGKEKNVVENPQTVSDYMKNAGANEVYKVRVDGTELYQLTTTEDYGEADVGVSEDGTLVSFIRQPLTGEDAHTEVWVAHSDGTDERLVYRGGIVKVKSVHDPEISPDNKTVYFSMVNPDYKNFPEHPAANTAHDLYCISIDGTGLKRLSEPGPISIIPNVQDGFIVFTLMSEKEGFSGVAIINCTDEDQTPLRVRMGGFAPKWIPERKDTL